jgi:RHS repeat-associated protein
MISAYERPAGYDYSSSGNILNDGRNQYTYDAENRIVKTVGNGVTTQYVYDAEGRRVAKLNGAGAVTASYVLGLGGEQMTEMDASGNWKHTNVFAGGKLMATYDNQGLHFHANDWLGTRRIQTGYDGTLELGFRSLPFGDGLVTDPYASSGDSTEHHFTAKERDTETGLDYFGARYYASNMGRFMTPDWAVKAEPVPYAKLGNPQTLNLYAYMNNNPLSGVDPDGHCGEPKGQPCPTQKEIIKEINRLADAYGVPKAVLRAVAKTESNFDVNAKNENKNKDGKVTSTDYGLFQVNSKNIGGTTTGADGKTFTIKDDVKTDWKANANAGAALVTEGYKTAMKEQNPSSEQDRGQQAYSQYNAGPGGRDRYLSPGPNGGFADARDQHYLDNYHYEQNRQEDK